jgi:copper chaperone for superoxide dismutase
VTVPNTYRLEMVGAAVCILETHAANILDPVRGLVRLVQVAPNLTIIDLTIRGLAPGSYTATVREGGDISRGAASTGGIWEMAQSIAARAAAGLRANDLKVESQVKPRGIFGTVTVGKNGLGSAFLESPVQIWELIGRSIVVSRLSEQGKFETEDKDTIVGVIARSAGVWDNDKTVSEIEHSAFRVDVTVSTLFTPPV